MDDFINIMNIKLASNQTSTVTSKNNIRLTFLLGKYGYFKTHLKHLSPCLWKTTSNFKDRQNHASVLGAAEEKHPNTQTLRKFL